MGGAPCAWLLVSLTLTLVVTPAMEEDHSSTVTSLDATKDDALSAEVKPIATGGYDEIGGYVHKDKDTMHVKYLDVAECRSHCDSDAKCQSFSYNQEKHDCLIAPSAIRFNPDFNYYSRMPWLHKKHIDDFDGETFGNTLGRYSVFTGMMYPARVAWRERRFISLDNCKDLCDADPPGKVQSNERLGETDPHIKYDHGDGCVAFSYDHATQTCLLNGIPMAYAPKYTYYAKRSVESEEGEFSKDGPDARKVAAKVASALQVQKSNAQKSEKAEEMSAEAKVSNNIQETQKAVQEQEKQIDLKAQKAAAVAENEKVKAAQAKANEFSTAAKKDPKKEKEKTLKETTEKDLRKETMGETQRHREEEKASKEKGMKNKTKMDAVAAAQLGAKNKEMEKKAMERRLKGNLLPMLNGYIDKAKLISNTERDLKKAIIAGNEHSTKENLVKAKVRNARMERMEMKVQTEKADNAAEAAIDQNTVQTDKSLDTQKQADLQTAASELKTAKDKLDADKITLQEAQSKVSTKEGDIASTKAKIESSPGDGTLSASLQTQEADLVTANSAVTTAEGVVSAQESTVGEKQGSVDSLKGEETQVKEAENAAETALAALQNVKYEYIGRKPRAPSSEESELYRKYAKEVNLPIPGDGSNPILPPAPPSETIAEEEEDPVSIREKMKKIDVNT